MRNNHTAPNPQHEATNKPTSQSLLSKGEGGLSPP